MATPSSSNPRKPFFNLFCCGHTRESPAGAPTLLLLLVAVTLIVSFILFPAGALNPPGAVRGQEDANHHNNGNYAGPTMYYYLKNSLYVFMVLFHTMAPMELIRSAIVLLSTSIFTVGLFLTCTSSFRSELFGGTDSVMLTCAASSFFAVTPHEIGKFHCVLFVAFFPGVVRNAIQIFCRV